MGLTICRCGDGVGNSGVPGCMSLFGVPFMEIFVPRYDSDGNENGIVIADLEAAVAGDTVAAFFSAFVNESDQSKRWRPVPNVEDVTFEREDNNVQTLRDGREVPLSQGAKKFVGYVLEASNRFQEKFDSFACNEMATFKIDRQGNIRGTVSADGLTFLPVPFDNFSTKYVEATPDTNVAMVEFTYTLKPTVLDSAMRLISADSLGNYDITSLKGLLDVEIEFVSASATQLVVIMTYDYGDILNPLPFLGAVQADFEAPNGDLFNDTTVASVTIDSLDDDGDGQYTFNYSAGVSPADELTLSGSKDGFDLSAIDDAPFTVS